MRVVVAPNVFANVCCRIINWVTGIALVFAIEVSAFPSHAIHVIFPRADLLH